jgi:hypothetical protein
MRRLIQTRCPFMKQSTVIHSQMRAKSDFITTFQCQQAAGTGESLNIEHDSLMIQSRLGPWGAPLGEPRASMLLTSRGAPHLGGELRTSSRQFVICTSHEEPTVSQQRQLFCMYYMTSSAEGYDPPCRTRINFSDANQYALA